MGAKPKVKKIGGSFDTFSFSLRGDNARVSPTYFEWTDGLEGDVGKTFVFGCSLEFAAGINDPERFVAILTEPRGLHPENYEFVENNHNLFHTVLSHESILHDKVPNHRWYPIGGCSISFDDWDIYPKTKNICMIVSDKNTTVGHKIRHEIVKRFHGRIDFYGSGVGKPFDRKLNVLKDYKYVVVVESDYYPVYFTEKLIDAIAVGSIPIYWGWGLKPVFDWVNFEGLDEFEEIISNIENNPDSYSINTGKNMMSARHFCIAEDYIWKHFSGLFT